MNRSYQPAECRCHDAAVFGHTDLNCDLALHFGNDIDWRRLQRLADPTPRPDPDGMKWIRSAWFSIKELVSP